MKQEPIKKEMLINVLQPEECRIAIVENGVLEELYVERTSQESYVGNIYKGRIVNIEPSIQAAFVDFGVGRNGFLHVSDVDPVYYRNKGHRRSDDLHEVLDLREVELPEPADDVMEDEPEAADFDSEIEDDDVDEFEEVDAVEEESTADVVEPDENYPLEEDEYAPPPVDDELGMEIDYEGQPPPRAEEPPRRGRGRGRGRGGRGGWGTRRNDGDRGPRRTGGGPRAGGSDAEGQRPTPRASRTFGYFGRSPEDYRRFGANIEGLEPVDIPELPPEPEPPPPVAETTPPRVEISPLPADLEPEIDETPADVEPPPERERRPRFSSRPMPPPDVALAGEEPRPLPASEEREGRRGGRSRRRGRGERREPERSSPYVPEMPPVEELEPAVDEVEPPYTEPEYDTEESALEDDAAPPLAEEEYGPRDGEELEDYETPRPVARRGGREERTRGERGGERGRPRGGRGSLRDKPPIQEIFRRGQEVLVQVIKEGVGTKGPTLSTYISIPGRYLVLMPGLQRIGVSRKITDEQQRLRLRQLLRDMQPPPGLGFIIRTAGMDRTRGELVRDLHYLTRLWQVIVRRLKKVKAPSLVYEESDIITRTIRDVFTSEIESIQVDEPKAFEHAQEFMAYVMPRYANRIHLDTGSEPLFHRYGIEQEIARIQERRIPLTGGGSIVIDQTEALVAIDVNSGNHRVDNNAEETAFRVNLTAAKEIARQLRLRDLGGVIVIDFIDMRSESHRRQVENALRDALRRDRARTKALRMSQFGIVEMTRQRIRPSLARSNFTECSTCRGKGVVKTTESLSIEVMRLLQLAAFRGNVPRVQVRVSEPVAQYLLNQKRRHIAVLEERGQMSVTIFGATGVSPEFLEVTCYDNHGGEVKLTDAAATLPTPRPLRGRGHR